MRASCCLRREAPGRVGCDSLYGTSHGLRRGPLHTKSQEPPRKGILIVAFAIPRQAGGETPSGVAYANLYQSRSRGPRSHRNRCCLPYGKRTCKAASHHSAPLERQCVAAGDFVQKRCPFGTVYVGLAMRLGLQHSPRFTADFRRVIGALRSPLPCRLQSAAPTTMLKPQPAARLPRCHRRCRSA